MACLSIDQIQFLKNVVSDKPLQNVLKNIYINNGEMQVGNGKLTAGVFAIDDDNLSSIQAMVPAAKFIQAYCINSEADEPPEVSFKKLMMVKAGRMTVRIQPSESDIKDFPYVDALSLFDALGDEVPLQNTIDVFKRLRPFIGEAGKTAIWSCGILLDGKYAYATNNVVLIRHEFNLDKLKAPVVIPLFTIDTLISAQTEPEMIASDGKQICFRFSSPENVWLQSPLIEAAWPLETVATLLKPAEEFAESNRGIDLVDITDGDESVNIHTDFRQIAKFCDDSETQVLTFNGNQVSTKHGSVSAELSYNSFDIGKGSYRAKNILAVLTSAQKVDFSIEPAPFAGDDFIGVMIGLR